MLCFVVRLTGSDKNIKEENLLHVTSFLPTYVTLQQNKAQLWLFNFLIISEILPFFQIVLVR